MLAIFHSSWSWKLYRLTCIECEMTLLSFWMAACGRQDNRTEQLRPDVVQWYDIIEPVFNHFEWPIYSLLQIFPIKFSHVLDWLLFSSEIKVCKLSMRAIMWIHRVQASFVVPSCSHGLFWVVNSAWLCIFNPSTFGAFRYLFKMCAFGKAIFVKVVLM